VHSEINQVDLATTVDTEDMEDKMVKAL